MSRGIDRERQVRRVLERDGWWTARAAGSLGDADIVAAKPMLLEGVRDGYSRYSRLRLIEVKANKLGGPFKNFGPRDRRDLSDAAALAGGEAWLAYWPARRKLQWFPEGEWP